MEKWTGVQGHRLTLAGARESTEVFTCLSFPISFSLSPPKQTLCCVHTTNTMVALEFNLPSAEKSTTLFELKNFAHFSRVQNQNTFLFEINFQELIIRELDIDYNTR